MIGEDTHYDLKEKRPKGPGSITLTVGVSIALDVY